ncbi:hypothetical protein AVEN_200192-1, partial [Araneus ventricosus]
NPSASSSSLSEYLGKLFETDKEVVFSCKFGKMSFPTPLPCELITV